MAKKFSTGIDLLNQRAQNVASATSSTDAPNWGQVMAWVNGLSWKTAVRAASTTNVSVSSPGTTIDGVTLASGDRILLKNQTTGSENGLYNYNGSASALTRTADGIQGELTANATVYASEGTINADTGWSLTTNNPITVGTTALTFVQIGSNQNYSAGTGLLLNGTTLSLDTTVAARKYSGNVGDGTSTTIVVTHNLGTRNVISNLRIAATGEKVECDDVADTINTITLTFGTAPSVNQYILTVMG